MLKIIDNSLISVEVMRGNGHGDLVLGFNGNRIGKKDGLGYTTIMHFDVTNEINSLFAKREEQLVKKIEEIQTALHNGNLEEGYRLVNLLLVSNR